MLRCLDRSKPKGKFQPKAVFITFFISALWHGTYPGYYIFFIACAANETINAMFPKLKIVQACRKFIPKPLEAVFLWFWCIVFNGWFGTGFVYLEFGYFHQMASNFSYYPLGLLIGLFIFVNVMPMEKRKKIAEKAE
jgi:lysophospholipid acyltransferase